MAIDVNYIVIYKSKFANADTVYNFFDFVITATVISIKNDCSTNFKNGIIRAKAC